MTEVRIAVQLLDEGMPHPAYAHPGDAGADLATREDVVLQPGERRLVGTGVALAIPQGYVGLVHPRSGLAARHGLTIVNAPGTVDAGYRGEVMVNLLNTDRTAAVVLRRGDLVAQLVVQQVVHARFEPADVLPPSARGAGGHGSSGGVAAWRSVEADTATDATSATGRDDVIFGRRKNQPQTPDSADELETDAVDVDAVDDQDALDDSDQDHDALEDVDLDEDDDSDDDSDEDDEDSDEDDEDSDEDDEDSDEDDDTDEDDDSDDEDDDSEDAEDEWDEFEASADWREDGPFDIEEIDLEGDDVARLDLGSLIITPEEGMQLQIVANAETNEGMALVVGLEQSALQLELRAAPSSAGFAKEIRGDFEAETTAAGGTCEPAKGPFGIELRRVVPATDDEGNEAYAPFRDWFAEGPRWLLMGRLMGEAALDTEGEGAAAVFEELFANLIVRRGDEAMAPGQIVPLTIPQG